jgi:hypothetical protein
MSARRRAAAGGEPLTTIGRAVEAWRAFWFRPAPLLDLAVARIIVVATALYLNLGGFRFAYVAHVPAALWSPIPLIGALGLGQPSPEDLAWLARASRAALYAALIGLFTRPALGVACGLQLWQEAYLNCFGKVTHGTIPLLWAMAFLACSPCGRTLSIDALWRRWRGSSPPVPLDERSPYARWPLELLFVEMAAFYFRRLRQALYRRSRLGRRPYPAVLPSRQEHPGGDVGRDLASPVSPALDARPRLRAELPGRSGRASASPRVPRWGVLFHLGTTWLMNVSFLPIWVLYLVFVPWTRLLRMLTRTGDSTSAAHHGASIEARSDG